MKKIALFAIALVGASAQAFASNSPTVTLGGKIDTYAGFRSQKSQFEYADPTVTSAGKVHNYALVNETRITVSVDQKANNGIEYGAFIKLNADTTPNGDNDGSADTDKLLTYVQSPKLGRLEAGSFNSASDQMKVSAASIASATGGIDGESTNWMNGKTIDGRGDSVFIKVPNLPVNCDCISDATKVTYFTPRLHGFQAGLSFTPDVEVFGTISKANSVTRSSGKQFEKIWDGGFKYQGTFKDVKIESTLLGEIGDAKSNTSGVKDRKDLRAWKAGATAEYKNYTIGGSYGDWLSSGRPVVKQDGAKYGAHYWTAGAAYKQGPFSTSLTYVNSERANLFSDSANIPVTHDTDYNKFENISLGVDCQLAPGFMPFAEVSVFKAKQSGQTIHNSGTIFLAGSKLSF